MKKSNSKVFNIDPRKIDIMEGFNQRVDFGDIDELAAQIKEQGLLEPISVVPYDKNGETRYLLVNGERRYRALTKLIEDGEDVGEIPANFVDGDTDDVNLLVQQFMRNEGKKFNDVEFGKLCQKLKDMGKSNSEIARMLGKNPGVITYALQSLGYDPRIREMIEQGKIGGTEVRRMDTAARKTYGDDWEERANEEILNMKFAAEKKGGEASKVSIKSNDLYGDVKDTKTFVAGVKVLKQYLQYYQRLYPEMDMEMDIFEMADAVSQKGSNATLRSLFDDAAKASKAKQAQ